MDLTERNHPEILSQNQNLHPRTCQATPYTQIGNRPVQPMPRCSPNTEASVTRTAGSNQTSSSNLCGSNIEFSYADVPGSQNGMKHRHPDFNDQAYQYGNDRWPMQPQMGDYAFQMGMEPSKTGPFREVHWLGPGEGYQNDFPLAPYMGNASANEALDALNLQERDNLYSGAVPSNQSQESYVPLFQSWPKDSSHCHAPSHLALLSEQDALPAVVPRDQSSSLRPNTILAFYPYVGYDSVLDIHAVPANAQTTGLLAEVGDSLGSQPAPMLNYYRSPSISVFPPLAEHTQHIPNGVDQLAVFEESSDISLESQQIVWDVATGDLVTMKTKRSLSNKERAHSQTIRNLGGQCEKCRRGKRKCKISHLKSRSEANTTSPSGWTCSDSESSLVQNSTHKRRKVGRLHLHTQQHGESLQPPNMDHHYQSTYSIPGHRCTRESQSESTSSLDAAAGSADTTLAREVETTVSNLSDWGSATFTQDNLGSGGQFSPGQWFTSTSAHGSRKSSNSAATPSEHSE